MEFMKTAVLHSQTDLHALRNPPVSICRKEDQHMPHSLRESYYNKNRVLPFMWFKEENGSFNTEKVENGE